MKKLYFLALFLLASTISYAQIPQGKIMLGGNFSFKSGKKPIKIHHMVSTSNGYEIRETYEKKNTTSFGFIPNFDYFVSENFSLGLSTGLEYSKTNDISSINERNAYGEYIRNEVDAYSQTFVFGPKARYYKMFNERFGIYGQGNFFYKKNSNWGELEGDDEELYKSSYENYSLGFSPGVIYFLSEKFALEATFGRIGYNWEDAEGSEEFVFDISSSSLNFGFQFVL